MVMETRDLILGKAKQEEFEKYRKYMMKLGVRKKCIAWPGERGCCIAYNIFLLLITFLYLEIDL